MSYGHGSSGGNGGGPRVGQSGSEMGLNGFYANVSAPWGEEAARFPDIPFPYGLGMFQTGAALTPMSLADGSFTQTRPSPVASHHSQEYQFNVGVSVPTHGLGITAPSATDFPQAMYHELGYAAESMGYGITETPRSRLSPAKRSRRLTRRTAPARSGTVHIWPHPDGAQRFEQERQQNQTNNQVSTRLPSSGWGRRDPHREEELDFVDKLRDEGHSWKIISQLYSERFKKPCTSAQLQMRRTRRRERSARWDENDIQVLMRARDQFEKEKYNWIADKMQELGASGVYTAEARLRTLDDDDDDDDDNNNSNSNEPATSRPSDSLRPRKRVRISKRTND